MKALKYLGIGLAIIVVVYVLRELLQKSAKTSIDLSGFDKDKKSVMITVKTNGENPKNYVVLFSQATKTTLQCNDFRLEVGALGEIMVFRVLDQNNREVAVKWFQFSKPEILTIYSEN